jgi:2Fe-2S ferredoxin
VPQKPGRRAHRRRRVACNAGAGKKAVSREAKASRMRSILPGPNAAGVADIANMCMIYSIGCRCLRAPRNAAAAGFLRKEWTVARVTFVQPDGRRFETAVATGRPLLQGAIDACVPGIVAECGGCCTSGCSRLTCQIAMIDALDGLVLRAPSLKNTFR